ncbi:aquaporin-8a.1 [Latimeria chalumnae]|nr:PREDICTED: aquaporin-8 [Latimeria chalumnae]|eukprot:XP_005994818.1 PREDICTED: aquaporin-8 [Latimeria chalumnae]
MTDSIAKEEVALAMLDGKKESSEKPNEPNLFEKYVQPCVAEMVGVTLIVSLGCTSVIENVASAGRVQPALAHGLAVGLSVAIYGEISGGHFNPAVSLTAFLLGALDRIMLLPYCVSQLFGGIIGGSLAKAMTTHGSYVNASGGAFDVVTSNEQIGRAVVAEIVMTTLLVITVCMAAINNHSKTPLAPLCVGFTVAVDILAGGDISGACMNPARAFGPAVVSGHWDYHWIYWIGPLSGSLVVAAIVRLLLGDRKLRLILK